MGSAVQAGKFAVVAETDNSLMALDPETGVSAWKDPSTSQDLPVRMVYGITGAIVGSGRVAFVIELGFLGGRERLLPARVETCLLY